MSSSLTSRPYRYLQIASTLCFVQAVFGILSAVSLGVPAAVQNRDSGLAIAIASGVERSGSAILYSVTGSANWIGGRG